MSKKNLILGGVLLVLLFAAYLYQGPWEELRVKKTRLHNFMSGIEIDKIDRIEIAKPSGATVLERRGDDWKIGGTKDFNADSGLMAELITRLKEADEANIDLASEREDRKADFQTSPENGTLLKLYEGEKEIISLVIGKGTDDYSGTYVSLPDDEKTYAIKTSFAVIEYTDIWHDRNIFASDKESINKLRFQYPRSEFTIEKIDGEWKGVKPYAFSVSEEKIAPILEIMSALTAIDIPGQSFEGTGLEKNLIIVQATGEGVDNTIMIGDKIGDDDIAMFYAKPGSSDNIYLIDEANKKTLETTINQLK